MGDQGDALQDFKLAEPLVKVFDDDGGPRDGAGIQVIRRGLGKGHASVLTRAKDRKQASRAAGAAQTRFSVRR